MRPSPSDAPAPAAPDARRIQAWNEYWSSGALHSCAGSFQGNYSGALLRFWQRAFELAPAAPRLLDLCCGNAPLAKLWRESPSSRTGGTLDAVDAAAIDPPWLAALAPDARGAIRIHAGVDAARLPFDAASFDLCMSQYGVEYVGPAALREARRVLRPGGYLAAVIHHSLSLPVRIAREELLLHAWLLGADGLLARAEDMLEPMARSADAAGRAALQKDVEAARRRTRYDEALRALASRAAAAPWPDLLHEVHATLAGVLRVARESGERSGREALAALRSGLARAQLRQRELVDCACDAAGLQTLLAPFGEGPREVAEVAFDNGELAGWAVLARRD